MRHLLLQALLCRPQAAAQGVKYSLAIVSARSLGERESLIIVLRSVARNYMMTVKIFAVLVAADAFGPAGVPLTPRPQMPLVGAL